MSIKLLGTDTAGTSTTQVANRVIFCRYICETTGSLSSLKVFSRASGNAKLAIYTDNAGAPGSLLASATGACTTNVWNDLATDVSYSVTAGLYYWIGVNTSAVGVRTAFADITNTGRKYKDATYSTWTFPASYVPTGFNNATGTFDSLAGFGDIVTPPNAPDKLIGTDTEGTNATNAANRVVYTKFTADATGSVEAIRVYSLASGNSKVALYSDNGSGTAPNALLTSGSGGCIINTWNLLAVTSYNVTQGTIYWIGINTSAIGVKTAYTDAGGVRLYKDETYSTWAYPATYNGTGYTSTTNIDSIAAYGLITSATDTIALTDLTAYKIWQRISGLASIPLAGTYTGTGINNVQARVMSGATVVKDWTTLTSATITGGNWSGTLTDVPQGGFYTVEVRSRDSGNTVLTTAIGTNSWGVGDIYGVIGSSTPLKWFTDGTETPNALLVEYNGSWGLKSTTGSPAITFGNQVITDLGIPVALISGGVSGAFLGLNTTGGREWSSASYAGYTDFIADLTAVGGKLAGILCHVGSNDGRWKTVISQADHEANFRTLISNLRTATSQSTLPIFIIGSCRDTDPSHDATYDEYFKWTRQGEISISRDTNVYLGAYALDLPVYTDYIHLTTAGMVTESLRVANAVKDIIGTGTYHDGVAYLNAFITGAAITVYLSHYGGTDFTPTTGITGFEVFDDGAATTISTAVRASATTILLTLSATPTGVVTLRYHYGRNPDVTYPVKDNSALTLPMILVPLDTVTPTSEIVPANNDTGWQTITSVTGNDTVNRYIDGILTSQETSSGIVYTVPVTLPDGSIQWEGIAGAVTDSTSLVAHLEANYLGITDTASNSSLLESHAASYFQTALGFTPENSANKATDFSTVNDTKYPTVQAAKNYADSLVAGLLDYRGGYDASGNTYPTTGGSGTAGAVLKGDMWIISVAGTLGGTAVSVGYQIIANVDTPGQTAGNWNILTGGLGYVPENVTNKVTSISGSSTDTQYPSAKLVYDQLAGKQASGSYLTAITGAGLDAVFTGASGLLKKTSATTYTLDTSAYLTGITADAPLSGAGTSASHLVIANAAADGSTKGAATFNATNFSASAGVINTIQGIASTASPQFANLKLTGGGGLYPSADSTTALYVNKADNTTHIVTVDSTNSAVTLAGKLSVGSTIELGHASDTTLTRVSAGVVSIEGANILVSGGALGTPASGTLTNCTFPTLNQNTTGSAATLTTARTINGASFNGSANILFGSIIFDMTKAKSGHFAGLGLAGASIDATGQRNYLTFDNNADSYADFQFMFPATYNPSATLNIQVNYTSTSNSGNLTLNVQIMAVPVNGSANAETDSFDTATSLTLGAPGTANYLTNAATSITNKDSATAGMMGIMRLYRSIADANAGVLKITSIELYW